MIKTFFVCRQKCDIKGAETSKPPSCLMCDASERELDRTQIQQEHNIVLVVEKGCDKKVYSAAQKVVTDMQTKISADRNAIVKFGVVTFGSLEPMIHTISDGELFGSSDIVVNLLEQIANVDDESNNENMGLEATYIASLYPFNKAAGKSVVMITCDKCEDNGKVS